ncbi:hypothetical protein, partial [[Flexibacter] sp. ATCC 35208]|uniref:hypothetical protein n=1 Tax=[Flexibacter] sp. ATCC 35208 TaxID=1936242 RepID=UPI001C6FC9F0
MIIPLLGWSGINKNLTPPGTQITKSVYSMLKNKPSRKKVLKKNFKAGLFRPAFIFIIEVVY